MSACSLSGDSVTRRPNAADAESVNKNLLDALRECLAQANICPSPQQPVLVAFSGGVDSTVLLHSAVQVWPGAVQAVHVHHGLQIAADGFESHCSAVCAQWNMPIHFRRLGLRLERGDSAEEKARENRYRALAEVAQATGASAVLLGQHANDQLETVLLALSRGAGVSGLAGMPVQRHWHGSLFLRPWLSCSGKSIRDHAHRLELPFIEDPSNADMAFTRNRIRKELVPGLLNVFPALLETMGRSARHCADAADLLDEQARIELRGHIPPQLAYLRTLPPKNLANLLRYWLRVEGARAPSTKQLEQLIHQIQRAETRGHRLDVPVSAGRVQRAGEVLVYVSQVRPVQPKPISNEA